MTKDYEADSTVPYFTAQTAGEVGHRMQSPYTRAEFVAREVAMGIDGQGIPGVDVNELDPDAVAAIRQRAEWNAQAAERAGITWCVDNICPVCRCNQGWERCINGRMCLKCGGFKPDIIIRCPECGELCRSFDLDGRGVCTKHGVIERPTAGGDSVSSPLADRVAALERLSSTLSDRVLGDYEIDDNDEYTPVLDRLDGLTNRMSTANARITAIEKAVRTLEQQVAPVDLAGHVDDAVERIFKLEGRIDALRSKANRVEHGLSEACERWGRRVAAVEDRENLHVLAIGELSGRLQVLEQQIDPSPLIAEHDRRLNLQLERITELTNRKDEALGRIARLEIGKSSLGNRVDDLAEQVRRLDADMAMVRDAVCPPQGAPPLPVELPQIQVDDAYHETLRQMSAQADRVARSQAIGRECGNCDREPTVDWPDPTPTMLESPVFEAIWQAIKTWDIAVPGAYSGYCGATGNHVRAILDAMFPAFTFDDWWTHFTRDGIYLGNGINVDRESTTGNVLYRYLRQTWNAAQGRATIHDFAPDTDAPGTPEAVNAPANKTTVVIDDTLVLDFDGPIVPKQTAESPVFKAVWSVIDGWFDGMGEPVTGREVLSILRAIRDAGITTSGARHDDLAYALGRAYVALKGLEPYEPRIADEEMEAIRRVLGNNYRDWLRPREAG